ncbi:hypothetical protein [Citrobacter sp. FDAARGOS_156]|uniref:hypothetical protein n=1 Tax=Citrobacter sp. FDAARGOS_156 TaxID=1702170 RepID=UPI0018FFC259|nr:hypothetical protein [Citrobacter sp. FDAARGOS_156]MBJ9556843.1 hypothetical protein [Citrobacter sp. FDAARGOS_156]
MSACDNAIRFLGSEYATPHTEGLPERGDTKMEKMKRQKRNKKATASANVMAGIRINSGWLNKLAVDITKIINEACP